MFKALYYQFPRIDERLGCLIAFVLLLNLTGCSSSITYSVVDQESIHTTSQQVQFAIRVNADKANFSDLKQIVLAELDRQFLIAEDSVIDTINIAIYFKGQPIWTDTNGNYKEFNCGATLLSPTTISGSTFQSYGQVAPFNYNKFKSWIYCRVNSSTSDFAFSPQLMLLMIGLITMLGGTSIVLYRRQCNKRVIPVLQELEPINLQLTTQAHENTEIIPELENQEIVNQEEPEKEHELLDQGIAGLDFSKINKLQQESEEVKEYLKKRSQSLNHDNDVTFLAGNNIKIIIRKLDIDQPYRDILAKILSKNELPWNEYEDLCRKYRRMPDGVIDTINEAASTSYDEKLLTREQNKVKINLSIVQK